MRQTLPALDLHSSAGKDGPASKVIASERIHAVLSEDAVQ